MNVQNVKPLSNFFFNISGFFMPFWWEWQLLLYILSDFPGIKNLNGLNGLNNLRGLNDLYSLISSKNLYFKVKMHTLMVCYFLLLEKAPKSHFEPIYFALLVWLTYHPVEASKIPAKINTFMLTRAELLIHLCYEIPCISFFFQSRQTSDNVSVVISGV